MKSVAVMDRLPNWLLLQAVQHWLDLRKQRHVSAVPIRMSCLSDVQHVSPSVCLQNSSLLTMMQLHGPGHVHPLACCCYALAWALLAGVQTQTAFHTETTAAGPLS
jgi:hypothetical protein